MEVVIVVGLDTPRINRNSTYNPGYIEVIVGTMYSGKTKELIERGERARTYGGIEPIYFKPTIDTRDTNVVSRNGESVTAIQVKSGREILNYLHENDKYGLVIIDEAQFFDESILFSVQILKLMNFNVLIGGLDKDFRGQPFGVMPQLMALSDVSIKKVFPVCSINGCVEDGSLPQRLRNGNADSALSETIVIEGSRDEIEYRPVCKLHHEIPDLKEYIMNRMYNTSLEDFFDK